MRLFLLTLACLSAFAAAPAFRLRDTTGTTHTPAEWKTRAAIVLFFVTTDCPVSNSYVPEMNRIQATYSPSRVAFYAVQAETATPDAEVARYAETYRYGFPLLLDRAQTLVRLAGATVTPQAAVLSAEGKVLYLGRIDNRVEDFGQRRPSATRQDLRIALDAVLAGKPVPEPFTKSIGCAINRVANDIK